jgi:uroporphyrinogen decarboxylase
MNSKERMQTAMEHQEPDRVPYMATFVPEMEKLLKERYRKMLSKIRVETEQKYQGTSELDILFDHDMLLLTYGISTGYYRDTNSESYKDEWGITWKKIPYETVHGRGYYTEIVDFPLADAQKIDSYTPPDPGHDSGKPSISAE